MKKKAIVIGLGLSGKSAAHFLLSLGYTVQGVDQKFPDLTKDPEICRLICNGFELKTEQDIVFEKEDLIVVSPGVPSSNPTLIQAISKGAEIVGEAELALRYMKQKAVAITGTNGKTTVTYLVEHVLCSVGRKAKALGNVGSALTGYVLDAQDDEIAVVELSSYQLESLHSQVFDAGVILNITPDHLDRYVDMDHYAKAKIQMESCIKEDGILFVYEEVAKEYSQLFSKPFVSFSMEDALIFWPSFKGHDLINVHSAWLLCSRLGVSQAEFSQALLSFRKPSHRIEFIKKINGVSYYDDSKGTNIDAVMKAVDRMEGPVVLIAGGVDKGFSYQPWKNCFEQKVKSIFAIGQAASKIQKELGLFFNVEIVDSLSDAVQAASRIAIPGDCVLLSPGCSSFDMFRDYAHRGEEFQRFVALLEERRSDYEP